MKTIIIFILVLIGIIQCFFWWLTVLIDNDQRSFSPWGAASILVCAISLWILLRHKNHTENK